MKKNSKGISLILSLLFLFSCGCTSNNTNSSTSQGDSDIEYKPPVEESEEKEKTGYFVRNGVSEYEIVVPTEATSNEVYSANQLSMYIMQATGVTIPVVDDAQKQYSENDKVISVGKTVYQKSANLQDVDYDKLTTGGYIIKNFGKTYVLDSACAEGVLYSVYNFLNEFFDVEFLTYDYTYLPSKSEVETYDVNIVSIPAFDIRDYYYYAIWYQGVGWGAKLGMNSSSFKASNDVTGEDPYAYYGLYYELDGNKTFAAREGHTIQTLLAVDAYKKGYNPTPTYATTENGASKWHPLGYFDMHPDWYAYDPSYDRINSRGYSQEEVCYTNGLDENDNYIPQGKDTPEEDKNLITKIAEICVGMVEEEPSKNAKYLMLGHADYYAECKCEHCQKSYKKYGTFGGVTAVWENAVVKEIKRRLKEDGCDREVKFVMFAYSKSIDAPVIWNDDGTCKPINEKVVLDEDIVVKMAYRNCVYHSLWDEECEQNDVLRRRFKGWSTLTNSFVIWDYTCCFTDYLYYMPNFATIQDNYKYYIEIGVKHLLSQGCPSEYNFYDSNLHCYVLTKMMWDPNRDVNKLIKDFNRMYFGEDYADYVNQYRDIYENYFAIKNVESENGFHASTEYSLDFTNPSTYSLPVLQSAINVINQAIEKAEKDNTLTNEEKNELILKLRSVKITPQYTILDCGLLVDEYELTELAKDFFESIDLLKLTYRSEGSTVANSFEEMKKSYGI